MKRQDKTIDILTGEITGRNFIFWRNLAVIFSAALIFLSACSGKPIIRKTPGLQIFKDTTAKSFPGMEGSILAAKLIRANTDTLADLALLKNDSKGRPVIEVWFNMGNETFSLKKNKGWTGKPNKKVVFLANGFFNRDRATDFIIIERSSNHKSIARLLLNNGKGYFYSMKEYELPPIHEGIERVDPVDIDRDGTVDLFFSGRNVKKANGKIDKYQAQIMINDGEGHFQDATKILLPSMRPGIVGVSFADYDGDRVVDAFLVYENGQNAMLINNGVGKLLDQTRDRLPPVEDRSVHADWADFDMDGDNDLLVVNEVIGKKSRGYSREYNYILENTGGGFFQKRALQVLPPYPSRRVYLFDANGSDIPDAIILSQRGVHYLRGKGDWQFARESKKRLPGPVRFDELTFADVNDDGYLDIFGITSQGKQGRLWINSFE